MDAGKCEGGTEQRERRDTAFAVSRSGRWAVTEFFLERGDYISHHRRRGAFTLLADVVLADIAILKTGSDLVK